MVPARHGSKGIPNKNIIQIIGRPLISYALEPLVNCNKIDSVYINSNSSEYLNIGAKWGARKYNRKESLSSDNTTMKEVVCDFTIKLNPEHITFDGKSLDRYKGLYILMYKPPYFIKLFPFGINGFPTLKSFGIPLTILVTLFGQCLLLMK